MCGTCSEKKVLSCDCEKPKKQNCCKNIVNVYVLPDNNSLNDSNSSCKDNISCYLNSNVQSTKELYIRRYHLDVIQNKCKSKSRSKPKYKSRSKPKYKSTPKPKPKKSGCGCSQ